MDELQQELFERQILSLSKGLEYPRTPDIAGSVMTRLRTSPRPRFTLRARRLASSLTFILVLFISLMLIPPARAAIIEFIQIGIVRIFRAEPTPLPPPNQQVPGVMAPVTATPAPTATSQPLIPILERFAGEMTLEQAQKAVDYPILLPSYPPELGKPDRVFVQDADGAMTVLVWLDPGQPDKVLMSLHFLPEGSWAIKKMEPTVIQETTVKGQRAVWTVGPYPMRYSNGDIDFLRLIDGHVLIWAEGKTLAPGANPPLTQVPGSAGVTYRLESDFSLEEAIKIAESLQPLKP